MDRHDRRHLAVLHATGTRGFHPSLRQQSGQSRRFDHRGSRQMRRARQQRFRRLQGSRRSVRFPYRGSGRGMDLRPDPRDVSLPSFRSQQASPDRQRTRPLNEKNPPSAGFNIEVPQRHLDSTTYSTAFRPSAETSRTPLICLALAIAASRSASVATVPDSETTPLLVSTSISMPGVASSASRLDLTLVVIQVSEAASPASSMVSLAASMTVSLVARAEVFSAKATPAIGRVMAVAITAAVKEF